MRDNGLSRIERLWCAVACMCIINPVVINLAVGDTSPLASRYHVIDSHDAQATLKLIVYGFIFITSGLVSASYFVRNPKTVRYFILPCSIPVLAILSATWAENVVAVLIDSIGFLGVVIFGIYMIIRCNFVESLEAIINAMRALLLISLLFYAYDPSMATTDYYSEPALRGIFQHKSGLGNMLAFLFILKFIREPRSFNKLYLAEYLLILFCLYLSKSTTGFISISCFFLILFTVNLARSYHGHTARKIFIFFSVFLSAIVLFLVFTVVVEAIGKDVTLTGRVPLWKELLSSSQDRFLLGHGFKAYFKDTDLGNSAYLSVYLGQLVAHAHSSYISAYLDLGLIGVSLFTFFIVSRIMLAASVTMRSSELYNMTRFSLLAVLGLYGVVESSLINLSGFYFLLFIVVFYSSSSWREKGSRQWRSRHSSL